MKRLTSLAVVLPGCALIVAATTGVRGDEPADLSISIDASAETVVTGSTVTYTVIVDNDGPGDAPGVLVSDLLPNQLTFQSCSATGGGVCSGGGNNRQITFATLAPGASETITIEAIVNCDTPDGDDIVNTASVRSSVPDPDADEDENETAYITASNPPPTIVNVDATPRSLWPPNHKMIAATIDYTVIDNCGPLTLRLDVSSNEPVDGTGDGHTSSDWTVVDAHHVQLRAERAGNLSGRVYTVRITATDSANQSGSAWTTVKVPHDRGH